MTWSMTQMDAQKALEDLQAMRRKASAGQMANPQSTTPQATTAGNQQQAQTTATPQSQSGGKLFEGIPGLEQIEEAAGNVVNWLGETVFGTAPEYQAAQMQYWPGQEGILDQYSQWMEPRIGGILNQQRQAYESVLDVPRLNVKIGDQTIQGAQNPRQANTQLALGNALSNLYNPVFGLQSSGATMIPRQPGLLEILSPYSGLLEGVF